MRNNTETEKDRREKRTEEGRKGQGWWKNECNRSIDCRRKCEVKGSRKFAQSKQSIAYKSHQFSPASKKNSLVHAQMVLGTAIRNMDEIKLKLAKLDQEKKRSQGKIIVHLVVVHLFLK